MYDNEFETRNIKFKPIMKLNHNMYIILTVVIDSDQERISLRAKLSYLGEPRQNARARGRGDQTCHTDEAGASLACYQSTLLSGTSFFSQWYFLSSERSTNGISREIVASCPFFCPSRLRRSLARSRETRFAHPNRRAFSQAKKESIILSCSDAWNPLGKAISQFRITVYTAFSRMSALVPIST